MYSHYQDSFITGFIVLAIISTLLYRDFSKNSRAANHEIICSQLFVERFTYRYGGILKGFDECIAMRQDMKISEYEARQDCATLIPTLEDLASLLNSTKLDLYKEQKCFSKDPYVALRVGDTDESD